MSDAPAPAGEGQIQVRGFSSFFSSLSPNTPLMSLS